MNYPNQTLRLSQVGLLTGMKRLTLNERAKAKFSKDELKRNLSNGILLSPDQIKNLIHDRFNHTKGKIIYIGNLKGGVGKTTLSYLLTNAVSTLGLKTCIIDLDVQANLTSQYIDVSCNQRVFYDLLGQEIKLKDIILELTPTLHLVPSSLRNGLIQKALTLQEAKHHLNWFNNLCLNYLRSNYDVIIVDTPPHLTTLNSVFCLCLEDNDNIVIPACAEEFSLMGIQMFLDDVLEIRKSYTVTNNPKISIIMNRFFQTQKTNLEMLVEMGNKYGEKLSEIIIRDSAKIREIVSHKIPLTQVTRGKDVYEIISSLLHEFNIIKGIA